MNKTKKILIGLLSGLVIAGAVSAATNSGFFADILTRLGLIEKQVSLLQKQIGKDDKLGGGGSDLSYCFPAAGAATGTVTFLGPTTATTTYISSCDTHRANLVTLNLIYGASTTGSVLTFELQWSHDGGTWFNETNFTAESNNNAVTLGATSTRSYTHNNVGTTTKDITVTNMGDRYMRVNVKANGGTGGLLYMLITKREPNN